MDGTGYSRCLIRAPENRSPPSLHRTCHQRPITGDRRSHQRGCALPLEFKAGRSFAGSAKIGGPHEGACSMKTALLPVFPRRPPVGVRRARTQHPGVHPDRQHLEAILAPVCCPEGPSHGHSHRNWHQQIERLKDAVEDAGEARGGTVVLPGYLRPASRLRVQQEGFLTANIMLDCGGFGG